MIVLASIQFDDEEIEVFVRALQGHEGTLRVAGALLNRKEDYQPVRSYLARIREHREPFDYRALSRLKQTIQTLVNLWADQATPDAWRAMGAPGSDSAVEGLARERQNAIMRAAEALRLVEAALRTLEGLGLETERVPGSLRARAV